MRGLFNSDTSRFFLILVIIVVVSFALAQCGEAQPFSAAEHCVPIYDDAVICYVDSFVVEAFGDMERALPSFQILKEWQRREGFLLTTNDPTRRVLVIYPWDFFDGPMPPAGRDGYVAELFSHTTDAVARLNRISWGERAQSFILPVFDPTHTAMLVYRRGPSCGAGR